MDLSSFASTPWYNFTRHMAVIFGRDKSIDPSLQVWLPLKENDLNYSCLFSSYKLAFFNEVTNIHLDIRNINIWCDLPDLQ